MRLKRSDIGRARLRMPHQKDCLMTRYITHIGVIRIFALFDFHFP